MYVYVHDLANSQVTTTNVNFKHNNLMILIRIYNSVKIVI